MLTSILCSSDRSEMAQKLYRHAAGLAAATGASLSVAHVKDAADYEVVASQLRDEYLAAVPYESFYAPNPQVFVPTGDVPVAILSTARDCHADLIVSGSPRRGRLAAWLLGSTSRDLLETTDIPVLLVPDNDLDIVTLGAGHPHLNFGAVIAAIDRDEDNRRQLEIAAACAELAQLPLILMTVVEPDDDTSIEQATDHLREQAHDLAPIRPHSLIVRRGNVADEIARCASAEDSGLVVMGLKAGRRGHRRGSIAAAVLANGRAAVLAVSNVSL